MNMIKHEPLIRPLRLNFRGANSLGHNPAAEQRARITPAIWDSAFTFSVVRDPYDYAISQFFYHLQIHCGRQSSTNLGACKYARALATVHSHTDPIYRFAFKEWLSWLAGPGHFAAGGIAIVRTHDRNSTVVTQKAWLTDVNNDYLVKHVVKLGSEEYNQVATCQGLALQLCSDQTSASCSNASHVANVVKRSEHGTRAQYYDAESCKIVAEWFAEDFSAFGYNSSACPFQYA